MESGLKWDSRPQSSVFFKIDMIFYNVRRTKTCITLLQLHMFAKDTSL